MPEANIFYVKFLSVFTYLIIINFVPVKLLQIYINFNSIIITKILINIIKGCHSFYHQFIYLLYNFE